MESKYVKNLLGKYTYVEYGDRYPQVVTWLPLVTWTLLAIICFCFTTCDEQNFGNTLSDFEHTVEQKAEYQILYDTKHKEMTEVGEYYGSSIASKSHDYAVNVLALKKIEIEDDTTIQDAILHPSTIIIASIMLFIFLTPLVLVTLDSFISWIAARGEAKDKRRERTHEVTLELMKEHVKTHNKNDTR